MMNKDRLGVLIGKKGQTKKLLEEITSTKIEINSETGEYNITTIDLENHEEELKNKEDLDETLRNMIGTDISIDLNIHDNSLKIWITKQIVEAINLGFKPEKALKLLDQEYLLDIINLEKNFGTSEKNIRRFKGRIIGEKGKMREAIEKYADIHLSVYKNNVSILGKYENAKIARRSISMILDGLPHTTVYSFLQKKYREQKDREFKEMWKPTFD